MITLSTRISIRCVQDSRPSRPRIWTSPRHYDVYITWLIEPMKIKRSVNSSIAGNRSMNRWPVNSIQLFTGHEDNSSFVWPKDESVDWGQQIRPRVNCSRSQSISKFSYSLFPLAYPLNVFDILVRQVREYIRRPDIVTGLRYSISRDLLNQILRPSINSSIAGNRSMNYWPVNRTFLQE